MDDEIKIQLASYLVSATKTLNLNYENTIELLERPKTPELGDFALPCFSFAKELKKSPAKIAEKILKELKKNKPNFISEIKTKGPYINFFIKKEVVSEVIKNIHNKKEKFGVNNNSKQKIIVESPAPNTNKPMHLGHIRNMVIGKALVNILNANGNKVSLINLNNDRGVHICKSMLAYEKFGKDDTPEKSKLKSDFFVGKYYVIYSKKEKENSELGREAQEMLKKWEQGDKEVLKLWKKMNKWALDGFKETYKTFDMIFEKEYFESETYKKGKKIIMQGLDKGIFEKEENNAIIVDMTKEGFDKKVLLREDGTTVYMTQDIYLAKEKYDDFHYDKSIYITGTEQIYHFKVLFKILKKLEFSFAENCYHLAYGMIALPEGKMKSREGVIVDADTLVDEVKNLAKSEIKKRHVNLSEKEMELRSKKIALGAIIFFILKYDPKKDFIFNSKESLNFEGETGPYCQYTYARIQSIIKKSDTKEKYSSEFLKEPQEEIIIKKLMEYPDIISKIGKNYKISLLARYILELCQEFNNYYSNTKIIQENKDFEQARLYLISAIAQVIRNGLSLLGIKIMNEM